MKNICFFGSTFVGLRILKYLVENNYSVGFVGVPNDNEKEIEALARKENIKFGPIANFLENLLSNEYYWLVNAWSPVILKERDLEKFQRRINLHPSYLPWGRGSHSASWSILEKVPHGVALVEMNKDIDAAPVFARKIIDSDLVSTGKTLAQQSKNILIDTFIEYWKEIFEESIVPIDLSAEAGSYHTKKETEEDRVRSADEYLTLESAIRWINAHDFSPHNCALLRYENELYSVKLTISKLD